jgi:hypothetical protein
VFTYFGTRPGLASDLDLGSLARVALDVQHQDEPVLRIRSLEISSVGV